jgi:hypothetical protein
MDMKKILQAMDGVSTKPVEGASSMSKFLRIVSEAELNQPVAAPAQDPKYVEYAQLMAKYDMLAKEMLPDNSGVEKGASPDAVASINAIKAKAAQLAGANLQAWEQARQKENADSMAQANANHSAMAAQLETTESTLPPEQLAYNQLRAQIDGYDALHDTPGQNTYSSVSPEVTANMDKMRAKLAQMAAGLKAKGIDAAAEYDAPDPAVPAAAPVNLNQKYQDESTINEGANPHKVALPVQMAMQHYQQPAKKAVVRDSVIKKYFAEAEAEVQRQQAERKQLIRQYASVVADRVLVKEGRVEERSVSQAQARTMAAAAHNPEFAKKVGIKGSVAKEFNKADTGKKLNTLPKRVKKGKPVNEAPIDATDDPNDPVVYGHEKANPMSLKGRIMQARAQLKELAQMAETDDLVTWEKITRLSKGGMFMGLEQNLEQIRHGINELVVRRRKGGTNARGIDKNIGE